jgi:hypothetical protein
VVGNANEFYFSFRAQVTEMIEVEEYVNKNRSK